MLHLIVMPFQAQPSPPRIARRGWNNVSVRLCVSFIERWHVNFKSTALCSLIYSYTKVCIETFDGKSYSNHIPTILRGARRGWNNVIVRLWVSLIERSHVNFKSTALCSLGRFQICWLGGGGSNPIVPTPPHWPQPAYPFPCLPSRLSIHYHFP